MVGRPALLHRLPKLRWHPGPAQDIVDATEQDSYPELAPDFVVLERELVPAFRAADNAALREQNTFYRTQLSFTVGAVLATVLGALQAALHGGEPALGLLEAGATAFLGAGSLVAYAERTQRSYYNNRLRAERLRSEYFLYLGRIGPYAVSGSEERVAALRTRVERLTA